MTKKKFKKKFKNKIKKICLVLMIIILLVIIINAVEYYLMSKQELQFIRLWFCKNNK